MNKLRLIKFFWLFSGFIAFVTLLVTYANIDGNEIKIPNSFQEVSISKAVYFYSVVVAIIIINSSIYFLSHLLKIKKEMSDHFLDNIDIWLFGTALIINFFIISTMIFLSFYINSHINFLQYAGYLIGASIAALVIWLFRLPLLLKKS